MTHAGTVVRRIGRVGFARSWPVRAALVVGGLVLFVALFGNLLAPHSQTALVGAPFTSSSSEFPLGTDGLGRDVLSRVLWGGREIVLLALLITLAAYLIGGAIGLVAGYGRSYTGEALMRAMDVVIAFPALLFLLVVVTALGTNIVAIVVGAIILNVPGIARIIHAATLETSVKGYVEAAVARGERESYVLLREILPNIVTPIAADAGPRLIAQIFLIAGLSFLGLGLQPPEANWALMITENQVGLQLNPWPVAMPVILIAMLTISINTIADAVARSVGTTIKEGTVIS